MTAEHVLPGRADWQPCQDAPTGEPGCIGSQLSPDQPCFAHTDPSGRAARLKQLDDGGPLNFMQGVEFTKELLAEVLEAVPTEDGQRVLRDADLRRASFQGDARFDGASFQGDAWFLGASFQGDARFDGASFQGEAQFHRANFQRFTVFAEASFQGDAEFRGASFHGIAQFARANFQGLASFENVRFQGEDDTFTQADFTEANFHGTVWFNRASFHGDARFDQSSFHDEAWFTEASFLNENGARFTRASFQGDAAFSRASIRGAWFDRATFQGDASFGEAKFQGSVARFGRATFQGLALFSEASFHGGAEFSEASFHGDARFFQATFQVGAGFSEASFRGDADFFGATFQGVVSFREAGFQGDARFAGASFDRPLNLGPILVDGTLSLNGVVFTDPVQVEATAAELSCRRTRFRAGGQLRIAYAVITLEDAEVPAPLILARHDPHSQVVDQGAAVPASHPTKSLVRELRRPLVVSVQRADVAKLTLTDLDLRPCRFTGAHHLDQLTINSADAFHRAPARVGHGRQVLAEECVWRHQRSRRSARRWPAIPELNLAEHTAADPGQLVGVYRQLRKGREDDKNEPGGADFYYGECEMRRHASDTPWAERAILTAYWLLSGYGLRAGRALLALLAVIGITVGLLVLYGLPQSTPAQAEGSLQGQVAGGQTITVQLAPAASSSVPTSRIADRWTWGRVEDATRMALNAVVFRSAEQQLTAPGRYIEMTARFLGPVLLTLAILAVRNRVKR